MLILDTYKYNYKKISDTQFQCNIRDYCFAYEKDKKDSLANFSKDEKHDGGMSCWKFVGFLGALTLVFFVVLCRLGYIIF